MVTAPSSDPGIEALLPHRGRMLLVDEIVKIDAEEAVSRATPNENWPSCKDGCVDPLLLIELVAQTSGLSNGQECLDTEGPEASVKGWLVGIKKAAFHISAITLGDVVVTHASNSFKFDDFREIDGICKIDDEIVAEVTLQVVRATPTDS